GPVALSVARGTTESSHFPTGMDTNYPIFPETGLCAELGRHLRRCEATRLDVTRQADAEVSTLLTEFFLSFAEVVVAHHLKRAVEGRFVVAAVVGHGHRRLVGKITRGNEVLPAEFGRVHVDFARREGDQAFDHEQRFGPARAPIEVDWYCVSERTYHVAVDRRDLVLAREQRRIQD